MHRRHRCAALAITLISSSLLVPIPVQADDRAYVLRAADLPALPVPVANNAVASLTINGTQYIISFAGIGPGRRHSDIHARVFVLSDKNIAWVEQVAVPGKVGRLAATAAAVGELAYVFGGYSVTADGTEVSTAWVHSFDPETSQFKELSPMPVPVDDAVSVVFANRYIYLISGWHDLGNVNLVQRYDTATDSWIQATPIPGNSLFGHAGGIVDNKIVYCDGVRIQPNPDGPRSFVANSECFLGIIDDKDGRRIDWRPIAPHPGLPRYRMASAGIPSLNAVLFIGGSENPYNFDGVGYDGEPSEPANDALLLNLETRHWQVLDQATAPTMDHRGLVPFNKRWVTVGGMLSGQKVSGGVVSYWLVKQPD